MVRCWAAMLRKGGNAARQYLLGTITNVITEDRVVALTFDDGPDPEFTPRLLDILQRHQARATFFMVGEKVLKHPAIVQRVVDGGHAIANHSWDHPSFTLITGRQRRNQIRACAAAIAPYGGLRLFRPPYGHQNLASRLDALRLGHQVIMFDVAVEDWCPRDANWMAERLMQQTKPGSIVALHDAIYRSVQTVPQYDREPMIAAVHISLGHLSGQYRFITIPELLRHGHPQRTVWDMQPSRSILPRLAEHPLLQASFAVPRRSAL
jgi:peptidoglycan-N-acetylglucosamine deacetylase